MTDWNLHLRVSHNPNGGTCAEKGDECPSAGFVFTVAGDARLADDSTRQWTEEEIDQGRPWEAP
jgi:hypothetical protein